MTTWNQSCCGSCVNLSTRRGATRDCSCQVTSTFVVKVAERRLGVTLTSLSTSPESQEAEETLEFCLETEKEEPARVKWSFFLSSRTSRIAGVVYFQGKEASKTIVNLSTLLLLLLVRHPYLLFFEYELLCCL